MMSEREACQGGIEGYSSQITSGAEGNALSFRHKARRRATATLRAFGVACRHMWRDHSHDKNLLCHLCDMFDVSPYCQDTETRAGDARQRCCVVLNTFEQSLSEAVGQQVHDSA